MCRLECKSKIRLGKTDNLTLKEKSEEEWNMKQKRILKAQQFKFGALIT